MLSKKLLWNIIISSLFCFPAFSQNQSALDFDGTDDQVVVPGGASLIAGSTAMSITCWVYPRNNYSSGYPDFDGFAGCRNDTSADFYLLQLAPSNQVEARFKNNNGTVYTIANSCLQFNTWQHLAFTYDGNMLRLYRNAVIIDSLAATGTILTGSTNDFLIGNNKFLSQADFFLDGKVDEATLWDKQLTKAEINCIFSGSVNSSDPNLKLYFNFNEGTPAGNNTSLTTVTDLSGHTDGLLTNFALSGTTSNFVDGPATFNTSIIYTCQGSPYIFNGVPLNVSGIYTDTLTSSTGCDSIVQLTLNVLPVDTSVTQTGSTLQSNAVGGAYKWVDCNNNYALIPGATSQTYNVTTIGSYAVIVKSGLCSDTSACYAVTSVGLHESILNSVSINPQIISNYFTINFGRNINGVKLNLLDADGRLVRNFGIFSGQNQVLDLIGISSGFYFLKAEFNNESKVIRLLKN